MSRQKTQETYDKTVRTFGDPLEKMAEIAADPTVDATTRLSALKEWASYGNVKVKAVELTGQDGGDLSVKHQLVDSIMQGLSKLRG